MTTIGAIAIGSFLLELALLAETLPIWVTLLALAAAAGVGFAGRLVTFQSLGSHKWLRQGWWLVGGLAMVTSVMPTGPHDAGGPWSRASVVAGATLLVTRPFKARVMLFHGAMLMMLLAILMAPGAAWPLAVYLSVTGLIMVSLVWHHLPEPSVRLLLPLGENLLRLAPPVAALVIVAYFLFPQVRYQQSDLATSGFADVLEPGRIARLALSDRLAFRARFDQDDLSAAEFYWRMNVLTESRGLVWTTAHPRLDLASSPPEGEGSLPRLAGRVLTYAVFPERHLADRLPALEQAIARGAAGAAVTGSPTVPGPLSHYAARLMPDLAALYQREARLQHSRASAPNGLMATPPAASQPKVNLTSRLAALVTRLMELPPEQQVQEILAMFRGFRYSLEPGRFGGEEPLDQFLFERKIGFCEHYAAAFASLLRLAGTPARVVTGFQGGDILPGGHFVSVYDADAHAWTEVWLGGQWRRVDPSRVVPGGADLADRHSTFASLPAAWVQYGLRYATQVLSESFEGFGEFGAIIIAILGGVALLLVVLMAPHSAGGRGPPVPWGRAWKDLERRLASRGVSRQPGEPVGAFLTRLALLEAEPGAAARWRELARQWNFCCYGDAQSPEVSSRLRRSLREARQWRPPQI